MNLSMILNNDGDDGGYASSPSPSPSPSPRASHVPASTRWSVDEMRSAVAILSDFQQPEEPPAGYRHSTAENRKLSPVEVDDEETEDEMEYRAHHRRRPPPSPVSAPESSPPSGFSGLDLLFQADAMIQKRVSPDLRPASKMDKSKKSRKPTKQHKKSVVEDEEDDDEEDEDDVTKTPSSSPTYLRSGFWTRAEEEYAAALIFYFLRGALPIAEGTTLRKYLAEQLCCNRRRVSMKLATEAIADKKIPRKVGASVFVSLKPAPSDADHQQVMETLDKLCRECFREVEDTAGTPSDRTPRHEGNASRHQLSPLVLGAKGNSPSDLSLATPARRKASKSSASPNKRRPSVASTPKSSPAQIKRRHPTIIRTGFDTPEEEEFVTALVEYFMDGMLELSDDTRLVTYLCEQLDCTPKALSMKLAPRKMGEQKFPDNIGSIRYTRAGDDDASSEIFEAEAHVFELRQNWLQAREDAETLAEAEVEDDDQEEKASVSSPIPTSSRKVKQEPATSTPTTSTKNAASSAPRSYSRSGPWSRHEEEYAAGLIDCFFRGVLEIAEGTTLRAFLTSRLNCNPMRISKKLASHTIADVKIPKKLGSATYVRRDGVTEEERRSAEEHLRHLEHLSLSEQHLKEDIVIGVIGHKHTREDEDEPLAEPAYTQQQQPHTPYHHHHHHHQQQQQQLHHAPHHRRQYSADSPIAAVAPSSPFKMRRILVDDYAAPHEPVHHHAHARVGRPNTSPYDHHNDAAAASMRYQHVAY